MGFSVDAKKSSLSSRWNTSKNKNAIAFILVSSIVFLIAITTIIVGFNTNLLVGADAADTHTGTTALKSSTTMPLKNNNTTTTTNAPTSNTNTTSLTPGNPSYVYTEKDKGSIPKPTIFNGTRALMITFVGNGTLKGIPITDTGTAYVSPKSNGSLYTIGKGVLATKDGSGISVYTFRAVGRYGPDGKLHDIGVSFGTNPVGSLAFLSNSVGMYKDEYDRSGNGMTTNYLWKR
jgi:hypothetical protein